MFCPSRDKLILLSLSYVNWRLSVGRRGASVYVKTNSPLTSNYKMDRFYPQKLSVSLFLYFNYRSHRLYKITTTKFLYFFYYFLSLIEFIDYDCFWFRFPSIGRVTLKSLLVSRGIDDLSHIISPVLTSILECVHVTPDPLSFKFTSKVSLLTVLNYRQCLFINRLFTVI